MERLRATKHARSAVVGVTWYTEENWRRVKAAATDPERFEETYEKWIAMAVEAATDLKTINKVAAAKLLAQLLGAQ